MPVAWSDSVLRFHQKVRQETLLPELIQGFIHAYNEPPSEEEGDSWPKTIETLAILLNHPALEPLHIMLEFAMPGSLHRADAIILGNTDKGPTGIVLEFKQWQSVSRLNKCGDYAYLTADTAPLWHPLIQAWSYANKIELFGGAEGSLFQWHYAAILPNMGGLALKTLKQSPLISSKASTNLIGHGEEESFRSRIAAFFTGPASPESLERLRHLTYQPTNKLAEILLQRGDFITALAGPSLGAVGTDLTDEQKALEQEVYLALKSGESKQFIVEGGPGSGKTLVALIMLMRSIRYDFNTRLAVRGNRLHAFLKKCLDEGYLGISNALTYFNQIAKAKIAHPYDLIICDEAQRLTKEHAKSIVKKAKVSIFFLDEKQRLNPDEEGTQAMFHSICDAAQPRKLSRAIRCHGGEAYHDWVECLISGEATVRDAVYQQEWRDKYLFEVAPSIETFIARLRTLGSSDKIAMVASFTESAGKNKNQKHPHNRRIHAELQSGFDLYKEKGLDIRWMMDPTQEYAPYWLSSENSYDQVASIYGAQGFEADYVGVIWGRDYIYSNHRFVTGEEKYCYDNYGIISGYPRKWHEDALELLKNRYRIFLTRGIKGTILFCEDASTGQYLNDLMRQPSATYS